MLCPNLTHLESIQLLIVLPIVVQRELVVLVVCTEFPDAQIGVSCSLVLAQRYHIVRCFIKSPLLSIQDEYSVAVWLLVVQVESWMDLVETTLVSLNSEFHLADSERDRLHHSILTVDTELDIVNELREYLWVWLCQSERHFL